MKLIYQVSIIRPSDLFLLLRHVFHQILVCHPVDHGHLVLTDHFYKSAFVLRFDSQSVELHKQIYNMPELKPVKIHINRVN